MNMKTLNNFYTLVKVSFGKYTDLNEDERKELKRFLNKYDNLDWNQQRYLKQKGNKLTRMIIHDYEIGYLKKKEL